MAVPTLVKTWQMSLNNAAGNQGSSVLDNRQILRAIKNQLLGFATNPWTTYYSNNGTTAGTAGDGVDRWTADSSLVWAGNIGTSAASWYVFQNNQIGTGFQMLWFLSPTTNQGNNERWFGIWISPSAGFTGGTTQTRPTATDEVQIGFNTGGSTNIWNPWTTTQSYRWHAWHSSDGQVTRFVIHYANWVMCRFDIGRIANATSGWTAPNWHGSFIIWNSSATPITAHANSFTAVFNGGWGRSRINGTATSHNYTSEYTTSAPLGSVQTFMNDVDFSYKLSEMGIWTSNATPSRGHHGLVYDLWQGLAGQAEGTTFPANGRRQFVQFGAEVFPWDGTPSVTGSLPLTA